MASFSIYMSKQVIPCRCDLLSIKCFFFMSIYVQNFYTSRRTGDELGLDYGGVWEQTAGETTWWRTISSFTMQKSFSQVTCLFSINALRARMCVMATKLSYYRDDSEQYEETLCVVYLFHDETCVSD